jgi:hypothetical protein
MDLWQDTAAAMVVALAAGYVVWRWRRLRAPCSGCGGECPGAQAPSDTPLVQLDVSKK